MESNAVKKKIRVLLDGASNQSLCRRSLLKFFEVKGEPTDLTISVCTGLSTATTREEKVTLKLTPLHVIQSKCHDKFSMPINVTTCKKIGMLPPRRFDPKYYAHLKNLQFTEKFPINGEMSIDLLIGEPHYSHLLMGSPILGKFEEPGAHMTRLGYAICAADPTSTTNASCYAIKHEERQSLNDISKTIEKFWSLDVMGIKPPDENSNKYTQEEEAAIKVFEEGAVFDEEKKRWTVALPWIDGRPTNNDTLGNNYSRAKARMISVEQRTKIEDRDAVKAAYNELHEKGWSEMVHDMDKFPTDRPWYCLISRPVIDWSRTTTQVRIIHDAGCKDPKSGRSLNDMLHQGPCLLPNICHVILRWRQWRWAFISDITKMFFQIFIPDEDKDFVRYMWRDFDSMREPDIFRMLNYLFGLKPSPFVVIYCVIKLAEKYDIEFSEAVALLKRQLYVDDILGGSDSKETARIIVNGLKELLQRGSFRAHKFVANDNDILRDLDEDDKLENEDVKALGVRWNKNTDDLHYDYDAKVMKDDIVTKRSMMSQSAVLYDLMGYFQPFILLYKIMLQEVWSLEVDSDDMKKKRPKKIDYDHEIEGDLKKRFLTWKSQIPEIKDIKFKRWTGKCQDSDMFIACFSDASENAYGACAYLVVKTNDMVHVSLAMSKSRLPPLKLKPKKREKDDKMLTIVRMELLGAVLASNLGTCVAKGLDMDKMKIHCFTDSLVNLLRIQQGPTTYKIWVASRIGQILEATHAQNWHFVPGHENPADVVSRGCHVKELAGNFRKNVKTLQPKIKQWNPRMTMPMS